MSATISTAPTPFDSCTKEELHDWLSDPVTEKLIASIKQHIKEAETSALEFEESQSDQSLALNMRILRFARQDRMRILEWIQGANRA